MNYHTTTTMLSLFTDDVRRNPFPLYDRLRRESPVLYDSESGLWMIFDYESVQQTLTDYDTFSSRNGPEWLIFTDPPRHAKLRALVSQAFTPPSIMDLEPRIRQLCRELLDQQKKHDEIDMATAGRLRDVIEPHMGPEQTIILDLSEVEFGEIDKGSGDVVAKLYGHMPCPLIRTDYETAEMVKYADNTWHALKVTFANEIGNIAKAAGVDGREVMEVVCMDHKLNLSQYYLRPGFAFGGSCLPKDVSALSYRARQWDVEAPLINSLMPSNAVQVQKAYDMIDKHGSRKVALLGLSFKAGTDDLRESPQLELAEMLVGKGFDLSIFDSNVEYARDHGANGHYIKHEIPHVSSRLRSDLDEVVADATLDQSRNGDQWHPIGEVPLRAGQKAEIRVRPLDARPCVADALHVTSHSRYNDGKPADCVQLAPMDGIILRRAG